MTLTTTDFRKNLFQIMDRVLNGELVEVLHKGHRIRLSAPHPQSKLARIVKRDTLLCPPGELEDARRELQTEMKQSMESDWADL